MVFQMLSMRGYEVKVRGVIDVKGKGQMETYFVVGKQSGRQPCFQRQPSHYSSLAAVVYAMAQTRRKVTGNTRKYPKKLYITKSLDIEFDVPTAGSSVLGRARTQQKNESTGRKLFNYSSMRLTHRTPANPVRRNTTRAHQRNNMHARQDLVLSVDVYTFKYGFSLFTVSTTASNAHTRETSMLSLRT